MNTVPYLKEFPYVQRTLAVKTFDVINGMTTVGSLPLRGLDPCKATVSYSIPITVGATGDVGHAFEVTVFGVDKGHETILFVKTFDAPIAGAQATLEAGFDYYYATYQSAFLLKIKEINAGANVSSTIQRLPNVGTFSFKGETNFNTWVDSKRNLVNDPSPEIPNREFGRRTWLHEDGNSFIANYQEETTLESMQMLYVWDGSNWVITQEFNEGLPYNVGAESRGGATDDLSMYISKCEYSLDPANPIPDNFGFSLFKTDANGNYYYAQGFRFDQSSSLFDGAIERNGACVGMGSDGSISTGSYYIYDKDQNGDFTIEQEIFPNQPTDESIFGASDSSFFFDGGLKLAIGMRWHSVEDGTSTYSGGIEIFTRSALGDAFIYSTTVTARDPRHNDYFGSRFSISADDKYLVACSRQYSIDNNPNGTLITDPPSSAGDGDGCFELYEWDGSEFIWKELVTYHYAKLGDRESFGSNIKFSSNVDDYFFTVAIQNLNGAEFVDIGGMSLYKLTNGKTELINDFYVTDTNEPQYNGDFCHCSKDGKTVALIGYGQTPDPVYGTDAGNIWTYKQLDQKVEIPDPLNKIVNGDFRLVEWNWGVVTGVVSYVDEIANITTTLIDTGIQQDFSPFVEGHTYEVLIKAQVVTGSAYFGNLTNKIGGVDILPADTVDGLTWFNFEYTATADRSFGIFSGVAVSEINVDQILVFEKV